MSDLQENPEEGVLLRRTLPDGRILDLMPLLFGAWRLSVGPKGSLGYYDDQWDYEGQARALSAMMSWDGEGEPTGWHRHPSSGRRRPGGDPAMEYLRP
jgi:hypothetical protein